MIKITIPPLKVKPTRKTELQAWIGLTGGGEGDYAVDGCTVQYGEAGEAAFHHAAMLLLCR